MQLGHFQSKVTAYIVYQFQVFKAEVGAEKVGSAMRKARLGAYVLSASTWPQRVAMIDYCIRPFVDLRQCR